MDVALDILDVLVNAIENLHIAAVSLSTQKYQFKFVAFITQQLTSSLALACHRLSSK